MTPATRRRRSTSTRTAITCRATDAAAIPRCSPCDCASAFRDLSQPRLHSLLRRGHRGVLAARPARAERAAAGRELFLLRLRAPVVPLADRRVHYDRLRLGA